MAEGKPGHGEAAPGDHLQVGYKLWLVGHQLEHGRAPWRDPYSFQPEVKPRWNLAGWPFGLVYWPLQAVLGTVRAWNLFVLLGFLGAGGLHGALAAGAGAAREERAHRRSRLRAGAVPPGAVERGHLLAWIAMLLPLSLYGLERARRHRDWWLVLSGVRARLDPALGPAPPRARRHPVLRALRVRPTPLGDASWPCPALGAGLLADFAAVRGTTGASGRHSCRSSTTRPTCRDLLSRDTHELEGIVYLGWTVR